MLRTTLVLMCVLTGIYYSLQGPFYALLFYVWNAYFRPEDWVWGELVRSLRLSLLIGTYVVLSTLLSRQRFVWSGRVVLLWSFLGLSILSSLTSEHSDYSWPFALEFLKIIVVTYALIVLTTDYARFRLVILTMVLSLGLESAKQGWFYLVTSPGWRNDNPIAFLGDNNGTAVGMLMLVPLIGVLIQTSENKWGKRFFGLLLIGCLYRALSTYSRGGFLAAIAMAGGWGMRSTNKLRILVGTLVVAGVVTPMLPSAFWDRMGTIETYNEDKDESALGRLHYWTVALRMAAANPVLGVGFNGYNKAYDSYDFSRGEYGQGRSVHSSIFGIVAETGYLGVSLYMMIVLGAFLACAYARRVGIRQAELRHLALSATALEASLIAFVVGGSFIAFQYNEMLWHVIGLSTVLMRIAAHSERSATNLVTGDQKSGGITLSEDRSAA
jgi:putative inorganic carbon (HCO3(-)) transporter